MRIPRKVYKASTISALLAVAAVALIGCSADGTVGGDLSDDYKLRDSNGGGVAYGIIDNPMNPNVKDSCYVKNRVEDQLRNSYDLAKYIEGRTVSDPTLKLQPLVIVDNTRIDTEMDMSGGVLEDVQDVVSKMSACHEMFLSPTLDLTGESNTQDFVLKIRFKEETEDWGTLDLKKANQLTDWEVAYDSTKSPYTKEIKRVLDDNGDMASTNSKAVTK